MRIFFASQSFYPSIGGVPTYLYNLARELESTGNEIFEIHLRAPGEEGKEEVEGINVFRVPKEPLDRQLLEGYYQFKELVYNESHFNQGKFNKPAEEMPGFAEFSRLNDIFGSQIGELLENNPGEIVHVHDFQLLYLHKFIPRGIPLIFTWHIPLAKNISKYLAQFLIHHISQFDTAIFSSKDYINTAIRFGLPKEKAKLIYPICNTHLFTKKAVKKNKIKARYKIPLNSQLILSVQRVDAKSGHEKLIKAFAKVKEQVPAAHLAFVGGQSLSNKLSNQRQQYQRRVDQLIHQLDLKNHTTFTGNVDYEKLPDLYNSADVYALLSLNEGFGLSITEAMACGLPVIGTRVGGIPEQIYHRQNGYLVNPDGSDSTVANHIIRLLQNPNLKSKMGRESLKIVDRKFKLEYGVEKHLNIYTQLRVQKYGVGLLAKRAGEISAIATDFDRTITDKPGRLNLDLLKNLQKLNPNLILVTGRSITYVKKLARRFSGWRCIIAENGAVVYFPENKQTLTFNSHYMRQARSKAKRTNFPIKRGRVILSVKTQKIRSFRNLIGSQTLQYLDEHTNVDERIFVPTGVNKAKSLVVAMEILNLDPEKLLIIGDGENDIDLFHLPGLKVAVANAHSSLKKLADYITQKPATHGVTEIINLMKA